jgi:ATP/ADP translocase
MERAFPVTDIRTGMIGKVYAVVDGVTFMLYALTGPLLRLMGIPITLIVIPFFLGFGVIFYKVLPQFYTVSLLKVLSKSFDYTLFKASKEILYIPLSYIERTRGKSIADLLTYRSAKGIASLVLLVLMSFGFTNYVLTLILFLLFLWCIVTLIISRRFRQKVSRNEEIVGC